MITLHVSIDDIARELRDSPRDTAEMILAICPDYDEELEDLASDVAAKLLTFCIPPRRAEIAQFLRGIANGIADQEKKGEDE